MLHRHSLVTSVDQPHAPAPSSFRSQLDIGYHQQSHSTKITVSILLLVTFYASASDSDYSFMPTESKFNIMNRCAVNVLYDSCSSIWDLECTLNKGGEHSSCTSGSKRRLAYLQLACRCGTCVRSNGSWTTIVKSQSPIFWDLSRPPHRWIRSFNISGLRLNCSTMNLQSGFLYRHSHWMSL